MSDWGGTRLVLVRRRDKWLFSVAGVVVLLRLSLSVACMLRVVRDCKLRRRSTSRFVTASVATLTMSTTSGGAGVARGRATRQLSLRRYDCIPRCHRRKASQCIDKRPVTLSLAAGIANATKGGERSATVSLDRQRRRQWGFVRGESTRDGQLFFPMAQVEGSGAAAEGKRIGLGWGTRKNT